MLKVKKLQSILLFVAFSVLLCLGTVVAQAQDLPEHWESQDIGDVATPGSATFQNDVFTLKGSGADIWSWEDAFHFAYQPGKGDCEISAYVSSVDQTAPDAKACVMIRETLDANSAFAMAVTCPGPGVGTYFQRRPVADEECDHTNLNHNKPAPVWIKLVREGSTFSAYFSEDGETWNTCEPAEIEMAEDIYIGLGVCAHNNDGSLCEATFENVVVDPGIDYSSINDLQVVSPEGYQLYQNYPNPFNPSTNIEFLIPQKEHVTITVFNLFGQRVATVIDKDLQRGTHTVTFDGSGLASGIYIYQMKSGAYVESKKLVLLK